MRYRIRLHVLIGVTGVLLAGCATRPERLPVESGDMRLLASIRILQTAAPTTMKGESGYRFYVRDLPQNVAGPVLEGYELRDGKVVDIFGGGSDSAQIVDAIAKSGLAPFEFEREVTRVVTMQKARAAERGEVFIEPMTLDGAEWEIAIATANGKFTLRAWNPGSTIDSYAEYSEDIRRLKAVIDLLALYYGRQELGL